MITYTTVVDKGILDSFRKTMGATLMNHAFNTCSIEDYLAVISVLWPEVVEVKQYLFISEFYQGDIDLLEDQYKRDRKQIELFVNTWSLADFFLLARDESVDNDDILIQFGNIVKYFWTLRFRELFPCRNVTVDLCNELMGERGMAITVYQS